MRSCVAASAALIVLAWPAFAHDLDEAPTVLGIGWTFEPWVVVCLALSAGLYVRGLWTLWRQAGVGRGVRGMQAAAFAVGWAMLVGALVSPLDPLGSALFSAHMLQHEVLMLLAAPLLVLGRPLAVWAWALPPAWRRGAGAAFHRPGWRRPWLVVSGTWAAWLVHAAIVWVWHVPGLFDAALDDAGVHAVQHLSFLFAALLFWWSVLGAVTRRDQGAALASLFTTMVHTGALGALLTFAHTPWYARYALTTTPFGLSPLEDQQLGGLIMWVPAGGVYLVAGLMLAARWLGSAGRSTGPA